MAITKKLINYSFRCSIEDRTSYRESFKNGEFSAVIRILLRLYKNNIIVRELVAQERQKVSA